MKQFYGIQLDTIVSGLYTKLENVSNICRNVDKFRIDILPEYWTTLSDEVSILDADAINKKFSEVLYIINQNIEFNVDDSMIANIQLIFDSSMESVYICNKLSINNTAMCDMYKKESAIAKDNVSNVILRLLLMIGMNTKGNSLSSFTCK